MNSEDDFVLHVEQVDGPELTIFGAPRDVNRSAEGLAQLLRKVIIKRVTNSVSWDELRAVAVARGIIIDPRDGRPHLEDARGGWNRDRWRSTLARDLGLG